MYKLYTLTGIAALAALSLTTVTQGVTPFYEQDFTSAVTRAGTLGAMTYGTGGTIQDGGFGHGGTDNHAAYYPPAFTTGVDGNMFMPSLITGSRNRGMSTASTVYLDTSSWAAGDYNVTFDVADYVELANLSRFGVYKGNISDADPLTLRVMTGNSNNNNLEYPFNESALTVSFDQIGSGVNITSNTSISYDFTLTDAGNTGDYLVLGWGNQSVANTSSDSFSVDNIAIVPEPGTYALIGGLLALSSVMLRRRR